MAECKNNHIIPKFIINKFKCDNKLYEFSNANNCGKQISAEKALAFLRAIPINVEKELANIEREFGRVLKKDLEIIQVEAFYSPSEIYYRQFVDENSKIRLKFFTNVIFLKTFFEQKKYAEEQDMADFFLKNDIFDSKSLFYIKYSNEQRKYAEKKEGSLVLPLYAPIVLPIEINKFQIEFYFIVPVEPFTLICYGSVSNDKIKMLINNYIFNTDAVNLNVFRTNADSLKFVTGNLEYGKKLFEKSKLFSTNFNFTTFNNWNDYM